MTKANQPKIAGIDDNLRFENSEAAQMIFTSAVVFQSPDKQVLTVRKQGTRRFMLVGGKPEAGENPLETARREAREETGLELQNTDLELLGMWQAPAANEPDQLVHGTVYRCTKLLWELPDPASEIAETRWLDLTSPLPKNLAPLLQSRVLPALAAQPQVWDTSHLEVAEYGYPGSLRDRLVAAIISGKKVATSSLLRH